ncbi:hypothetical protein [Brevundimonas sp. NPDC058933]|uniref:hypothetical protein n=1 Tax=Brevundimonas sp. NPDC058933 TaxID=3346673 RepID=UPI003BEEC7F6
MFGCDHNPQRKAYIERYLADQGLESDLSFYLEYAEDAFEARDKFGRLAGPILIVPRRTSDGIARSGVITFADEHDAVVYRMFYDEFGGEE